MEVLTQIIAGWGAVLATALALLQMHVWRKSQPKIEVKIGHSFATLTEEDAEKCIGTPITVLRGWDELLEEFLISLTIVNRGGTPIQIVGALIETRNGGVLRRNVLYPEGLPVAVEPLSSLTIDIPKEPIDNSHDVTFVGVVDALGRRYSDTPERVAELVSICWQLPTRLAHFARRDDPEKVVVAYRLPLQSSISSGPVIKGTKSLATRSKEEANAQVGLSHRDMTVRFPGSRDIDGTDAPGETD